jgi:phospholipase/lecithinase/hemolysin
MRCPVISFSIACFCFGSSLLGFSSLVIFGDSLSDVGNVSGQTFGIAPGSNYFQGRYSNGPLWVEQLALDQGLPAPVRSRSSGSDWAYAGTKTGPGTTTFVFFSFPNLGTQINNYLNGRTPAADELFVVWGGGNDFIDGQTNPSIPVTNITNHVTALANAGAKHFLVPNLPLLGNVPRFNESASSGTMNLRSGQFNAQLATALTNLESSLDIEISQLDVGGFFSDALANPGKYGFTNVTDPALVESTVVPNPDQYLFYDDIHPTRVGHRLLGSLASDLLDTHTWIATTNVGTWNSPANWDPPAAPDARWIVELTHNTGGDRTALVAANSTVRRVHIEASSGSMSLEVSSGATLTAQSLEMEDGARLAVELAATGQHGRIALSGEASLDGELAVSLAPDFIALPGSTFQVLSFGSRAGELNIENETGFAGLNFTTSFSATDLTLTANAIGGDADLNGVVDVNDLGLLASHWQTSGNWLAGDFDGSGTIDVGDLGILASNWQQGDFSSFGFSPTSIPEAGGVVFFALMPWSLKRPRRAGHHMSSSFSTATTI